MSRPAVMLFDADCGLCTASAAWVVRRAPAGRMRAVPLQEAGSRPELASATEGLDLRASLHVVMPDGSVRAGAASVLAAARVLPRWGLVARLIDHRVGHAVLEPWYRLIARRRHRIGRALGIEGTCTMPMPPPP